MTKQLPASVLEAGRDYPRIYAELCAWFPDDGACLDYLEWLRWPNGFVYPRCETAKSWRMSDGRFWCKCCRRRVSVTVGTIFYRTRTPLTVWFAVAAEVLSPKGFGRVRMRCVPDASRASLVPFVCDVVEQGATVLTDGWGVYNDLARHGFIHRRSIVSDSGDPAHVSMPGVHRVSALLKRWLLGTHQGAVESDHLQGCLDEFTFRFNRRRSDFRGLLFRRLLEQAVQTGPLSYRSLVENPAPKPLPPRPQPVHRVSPASLAVTSSVRPWRDHNRLGLPHSDGHPP
jgi:hypothetical protein